MTESPTDTKPTFYKRVTIEALPTPAGLAAAVMNLPDSVPLDASITNMSVVYGCSEEAHEDPDIEHEPEPLIALTLEWEVDE